MAERRLLTHAAPESLIFLVPGFPKDEQDTACLPPVQNYVAAYAAAHPEQDVHVIAFQYPFVRTVSPWKGATVHALGGRNRSGARRLPTWARAARTALRIGRTTRVRALHSFWLNECAWVGGHVDRILRVPHVASSAGQDAKADNPYLNRLGLSRMTTTAGSRFAADTFQESTGRAVDHVILLGLDIEHLDRFDEPATRDIDVLGVGSLIPIKDYAAFVRIVAAVRASFPGLRAVLIGEGPERERLADQIDAAGLEGTIRLVGKQPRDDVYRTMLRSRVLLHPSRYEGQGYVFLEAVRAGLSVVCRPVGRSADQPDVYPCGSEEEMRDRLRTLLAGQPVHDRRAVVSVQETVAAFERLYGSG